jgi:hypothetical protein
MKRWNSRVNQFPTSGFTSDLPWLLLRCFDGSKVGMAGELQVRVGTLSSFVRTRTGFVRDVQIYQVGVAAISARNGTITGPASATSAPQLLRLLVKWNDETQEVIVVENFDVVVGNCVSATTIRENNTPLRIAFRNEDTGLTWIAHRLTTHRRSGIRRVAPIFPIVGALLPIALLGAIELSSVFGLIAGTASFLVTWLVLAPRDMELSEYTGRLRNIASHMIDARDHFPSSIRQSARP